MRFLVQSLATGRFLCPSIDDGQPVWVASLRDAGGGVLGDLESAVHLIHDCDFDDLPIVIDLDRLGTINDYPVIR